MSQTLSIRGALNLLQGDADRGVQDFEQGARLAPGDSPLLSDLAAGYISRARRRDNSQDIVSALVSADRALAADESLSAAWFNRALALERLSLLHSAVAAWSKYLEVDRNSPWAEAARSHLVALEKPRAPERWEEESTQLDRAVERQDLPAVKEVVGRFPMEVRERIEEDVLGEWADAAAAQETAKAAQALHRARILADVLRDSVGEQMPADAVAAVDNASREGDRFRVAALVEGHRNYRLARERYRSRKGDAGVAFTVARTAFQRGQSPMADWASLYLAILLYEKFEFQLAEERLLEILRPRQEWRYPGLLTRTFWMLGLTETVSGDPVASVEAYRSGLALADKTRAREDSVGIYTGLAASYQYLGDTQSAWNALSLGLAMARDIGSIRRRHALLDVAADLCLGQGEPSAAVWFRDEVVHLSIGDGEPVAIAHALLRRSEAFVAAGDLTRASADIDQAQAYLYAINRPDLRHRIEADRLAALGEAKLRQAPAEAYEYLTQALALHDGKENHYTLGRVYLARARAALASGNSVTAEADLGKGIEEYERQWRRVREQRFQISFFDQPRALFDEMIALKAARPGGEKAAFDLAERNRARALLDRVGSLLAADQRERLLGEATTSLSAQEIQADLPAGVAIVEYSLLRDRLLAWIVQPRSLHLVSTLIPSAAIEQRIAVFQRVLARKASESELRAASAPLYDILIRPLLPSLRPEEAVVFSPDRALHQVPFAALFNRERSLYLVQERPVSLTPSATLFLRALQRDRRLETSRIGPALVVGNPRFKPENIPDLQPLPEAEEEARVIATMLPGSLSLLGSQATKKRFLAEAGHYEIVHFSGHARVNREFPLLSHLVLAPDGDLDRGLLYAHELYGLQLERTRLVVLAACNTASGPTGAEGVISLGRAFFGAGVPAVVASLWNVGDWETGAFFRAFYQHLRRRPNPAEALRSAQLEMLSSLDSTLRSPQGWAAFEFFGASTTRNDK
ncbi:MAG TPA: CHAT domain-containing protein [Thermoanaerobaculia bacterium]|jgi:CHAT domain-containing protein|nr:CHAT domain-containing protein [Thermoanaerobaculia bacterium]